MDALDRAHAALLAHQVRELILIVGKLNALTGIATEQHTAAHAAIKDELLDLFPSATSVAEHFGEERESEPARDLDARLLSARVGLLDLQIAQLVVHLNVAVIALGEIGKGLELSGLLLPGPVRLPLLLVELEETRAALRALRLTLESPGEAEPQL